MLEPVSPRNASYDARLAVFLSALALTMLLAVSAEAQLASIDDLSLEVRSGPAMRTEGAKTYALHDESGRLVALLVDLPGDPGIVSGNPLSPIEEFIRREVMAKDVGEDLGRAERVWTNGTKYYRADYERAMTCWGFGADEHRRGYIVYTDSCVAWRLRVRLDEFMHRGLARR